ncbi:MAG: response regulator transcription factor [Bacteroidia bacterium]|nr:response regulator transcription factor [Bacteroidia bacterium]
MKVIIIDDEPLAQGIVKHYLSFYSDMEVLATCNDGFEGVKAIMKHEPDLIFLDIQMPKISGFEMLELIENKPKVIFTTAFDEYALKAFDQNAIDYLLKPFSQERFDKAMQKCLANNPKSTALNEVEPLLNTSNNELETRVVVKHLGAIKIIQTTDILYLEAYDDYVKIYTHENVFVKKKTMSYFEQAFNPKQFVRVHRSFIVQVNQINKMEQSDKETMVAILKNGTKIPLSKSGYPKLKAVLGI